MTDNLTSLVWTKDANLFGEKNWYEACEACNGLADDGVSLTDGSMAGDWRLPNLRELQSLIHYGFHSPALPNTEGTGQWTSGNPFTDVETNPAFSVFYWSSTTNAYAPGVAWQVDLERGGVSDFGYSKDTPFYVWCVRGGN